MSDRKPPRPKGSGTSRRGAPARSGSSGAARSGSGGHGKSSTRGSGAGKSAGGRSGNARSGSGRFDAKKGQSYGKGKSAADRGTKGRATESGRGGDRPSASDRGGSGRSTGSGRGRGTEARGSSAKRYTGGSKSTNSEARGRSTGGRRQGTSSTRSSSGSRSSGDGRTSSGHRRDSQPPWDRSRRTEPSASSQQRTSRGTGQRGGASGHRTPRDPLIEEIRGATPKAKQEAAIAVFEHARDLLERGRDGGAADAAADAKRLAPRSGAVRELYGVALYRAGRYRDALRELQAYRRMSGRLDQNHLIADSYRGLGMPEKAVPVAVEAVRSRMRDEPRAEAAIVGASALADLGRFDEAIGLLRGFPGRHDEAEPWELRVWYVAGDVLARSGRPSEAAEEFRRIVRYDAGAFDAAERLAALTV
jgi:thioredoxin-like negative regulator of GroEL